MEKQHYRLGVDCPFKHGKIIIVLYHLLYQL